MATPRVFHGARAVLAIDGRIVGYMTNCNGGEQITQLPIEVCGDPYAQGHEPVGVTVQFTSGFLRILDTDAVAAGILPKSGALELTEWPEMDALIKDVHDPDRVLYKIEGVKPTNFTFDIQARSLCQQQASFVGRKMKHGSEV